MQNTRKMKPEFNKYKYAMTKIAGMQGFSTLENPLI